MLVYNKQFIHSNIYSSQFVFLYLGLFYDKPSVVNSVAHSSIIYNTLQRSYILLNHLHLTLFKYTSGSTTRALSEHLSLRNKHGTLGLFEKHELQNFLLVFGIQWESAFKINRRNQSSSCQNSSRITRNTWGRSCGVNDSNIRKIYCL